MKIYATTCNRCLPTNTLKPHIIIKLNKLRGVKLKCLICGHIKSNYSKKELIEWEEQTITKTIAHPFEISRCNISNGIAQPLIEFVKGKSKTNDEKRTSIKTNAIPSYTHNTTQIQLGRGEPAVK